MAASDVPSDRDRQVAALLLSSADACAVISRECRPLVARAHRTVPELLTTIRESDVAIVVVDVVDAEGRSMSSAVEAMRGLQSDLPILGYCRASPTVSSAIPDFVRSGATGLLFRGIDDVGIALRGVFRSARRSVIEARIYREVALSLPGGARPLLRYAIARSGEDASVADAAQSLGVDRKTLLNRLDECGQIGPREFINWIRLALAVGLLEQGGRSAEQVALEVGFPSGTSFRNMLVRYAGKRPSELCESGGLSTMLTLFRARLSPRSAPAPAAASTDDHGIVSLRRA